MSTEATRDRRQIFAYLAGSVVATKNYLAHQREQKEIIPRSFEVVSLTFHEVAKSDQILETIYPFLENGYIPLSIHDILQALHGKVDLSQRKSFLITLDDGLQSQKNAVLAVEYAERSWGVVLPLLFAVITQFAYYQDDRIPLDTPSYNDHVHEYLTKKDILKIMENPNCHLANHTFNHADLTSLAEHDLLGEITIAQRRLSVLYQEAGRKKVPKVLIYPFGRYNNHVIKTISALNFEAAFTTEHDTQYSAEKRYRLGRIGKT